MPSNRYYSGPVSDHYDGNRFFNPDGVAPLGLRAVWRWKTGGGIETWPKQLESPFVGTVPAARVDGDGLRVTMIGHAALLIQVAGLNILIDPVFAARVGPLGLVGPKRVTPPGVAFDALPAIDLVIVTHNHYDHLDLDALKRLVQVHAPRILTPLGNDTIIRRAIPQAAVEAMDWGDGVEVMPGVSVHCEPCHHWSARGVGDRSMALWAAFVIATPAGRIYHVGDTGFHDGINYRAVQARYGSFRLANLPIGAYEPRWFMKGQHQNPEEAVEGMRLCHAAYVAGHHWRTFQLTNEAPDTPRQALFAALDAAGIARERFRPMLAGEVFDVPPVA
ncbi:L-ascorbate metabolism protein UlaG, beta-lactamase superfamily [Rhizobium sp. RU20A]|uniref:MBL fold metallo-hydrolase n=1 Tax=Rhizobium sp. RU20A TaxID=1907412 RepID=UPI0009548B53|nr:MBL fold metallo-hydrolase [Rhizobium sp. RU20A]SIQ88594.1 L-ascorbate metabolism protein UlaG, beta-lactamase superfamily [Rhizobium sp. RU20A]